MNFDSVHRRQQEVDERRGSRAPAGDAVPAGGRGGVRRSAKPTDGVAATVRLTAPLSSYAEAQNRAVDATPEVGR
jgi:hypothetical protein